MATLTSTQRARVSSLIDYLAYNHDLPIDASVVEQLDIIFGGTSGFPCACGVRGNSLRDSFRDEPIRTFIRLLVALSDSSAPAVLTALDRARLQWLLDYLAFNHDLPIDARVVEVLDSVFGGTSGFNCRCGVRGDSLDVGFRDEPIRSFLRLLLAISDAGLGGGGLAPTLPGVGVPAVPPGFPGFLGAAASYGVLGGQTVTNTGLTFIGCDLGLYPGSSVTGFPPGVVSGETNIANLAAQDAQNDLLIAYLYLEGLPPDAIVAGNIGGQTLAPGVYKSNSSLEISSGDLTLDAQGNVNAVFIFQVASALTTTVGRAIILAGGAQAKNVYFQVGSSATIGVSSIFKGNVLALSSITAATGADIEGRLLARNASVTSDSNPVICPV